ncbi:MAG: hypothetical protein GF355_18070 [Candidatus Eisenbacteria bacterium]|nr:hypothetical protein [Candidatus Eisenbacteria bacterium]
MAAQVLQAGGDRCRRPSRRGRPRTGAALSRLLCDVQGDDRRDPDEGTSPGRDRLRVLSRGLQAAAERHFRSAQLITTDASDPVTAAKFLALAAGAVLLTAAAYLVLLSPEPPPARDPSSDGLRITVANVYNHNGQVREATEALASTSPDVGVILEWTGRNIDLEDLLSAGFKVILNHPHPGTHGLCVLARPELGAEAAILANEAAQRCRLPLATVRIPTSSGGIGLIGLHAPPPLPNCGRDNSRTLKEVGTWIESGRALLDRGAIKEGDRIVVAGDFNALPFFAGMGGLRDSGLENAGPGVWGLPLPTWRPGTRLPYLATLDYAFVSAELGPAGCWLADVPGSDHRLIVIDVRT